MGVIAPKPVITTRLFCLFVIFALYTMNAMARLIQAAVYYFYPDRRQGDRLIKIAEIIIFDRLVDDDYFSKLAATIDILNQKDEN